MGNLQNEGTTSHAQNNIIIMKNTLFSIAALIVIILVSCNSPKKADSKTTADMHTSENSLDWHGTYYGVTPCASCPGIETELTLTPDLNYIIHKT